MNIKSRGPRYASPPRSGWQSLHWRGSIKTYVRAVEELIRSEACSEESLLVLCVCVSDFGLEATCFIALVFSVFLII